MALYRGITCIPSKIANFSNLTLQASSKLVNSFTRLTISCEQTRCYRRRPPLQGFWRQRVVHTSGVKSKAQREQNVRGFPHTSWIKEEPKYVDDMLTKENADFIQEYIRERGILHITQETPLKEELWPKHKWTPESRRTGIIARKIGVYPMWMKNGNRVMTTLLQVLDNHVIKYFPPEECTYGPFDDRYKKRGLAKVVVGADEDDPQKYTASYLGLFKEAGVLPKKKLTRFFITPDALIKPGTPLGINHFRVGEFVDVSGISVFHGHQGVMKRWGFKGNRATHGVTKSHRRPGCIGHGRKTKVMPGKKMPGLTGGRNRKMSGLQILRMNTKYNVIWVRGTAVPGPTHGYVNIKDTLLFTKKTVNPPFPTFYPEDAIYQQIPEEMYDQSMHDFGAPSIVFQELEEKRKNPRKQVKKKN